ncbi:hypothetical protein ES703_06359 [subsurface metagenome]
MRGLGIPRTDVERLMEHRGISAGEAEELLRVNPAEALLPQRGTGLLLGTAAEVHSPFPTSLRVEGTNHHQVDVALGGIIRAIKLWKNVGADGTRDVMAAYGTGTTFDTFVMEFGEVAIDQYCAAGAEVTTPVDQRVPEVVSLGLKNALVGVGKWDLDTGAITLDDYDITVDAINVITPPTTEPRGEQVTVAFAAL